MDKLWSNDEHFRDQSVQIERSVQLLKLEAHLQKESNNGREPFLRVPFFDLIFSQVWKKQKTPLEDYKDYLDFRVPLGFNLTALRML